MWSSIGQQSGLGKIFLTIFCVDLTRFLTPTTSLQLPLPSFTRYVIERFVRGTKDVKTKRHLNWWRLMASVTRSCELFIWNRSINFIVFKTVNFRIDRSEIFRTVYFQNKLDYIVHTKYCVKWDFRVSTKDYSGELVVYNQHIKKSSRNQSRLILQMGICCNKIVTAFTVMGCKLFWW